MDRLLGLESSFCGHDACCEMILVVKGERKVTFTNRHRTRCHFYLSVEGTQRAWKGYILFNPVGNNHPKDVKCKLDSDELTAGGVLRRLCRPDRSNGVQDTSSDTIKDTSYAL